MGKTQTSTLSYNPQSSATLTDAAQNEHATKRSKFRHICHFILLLRKHFIVIRRSFLWTVFEIFLPLVVCVPLLVKLYQLQNAVKEPDTGIKPNLTHHFSKYDQLNFDTTLYADAYYTYERSVNKEDAYWLQNQLTTQQQIVVFDDADALRSLLKANNSKFLPPFAYFVKKLDKKRRILHIDLSVLVSNVVEFKDTWNPPLFNDWSSSRSHGSDEISVMLLPLYKAFIKLCNMPRLPPVLTKDFTYQYFADVEKWMGLIPITAGVLMVAMLPSMIHSAREVTAEKESGMKAFLVVMGVSRISFYLSHIVIAWCKGIFAVVLPIFAVRKYFENAPGGGVDMRLMYCSMALYVLAAACFSVALGTFFRKANTTVKMMTTTHCVLGLLTLLGSSSGDIYKPQFLELLCLNYNNALRCIFAVITSHLLRNKYLTFSNMFDDHEYMFNVGHVWCVMAAFIALMLLLIAAIEGFESLPDFSLKGCFARRRGATDLESQTLEGGHEKVENERESDIIVEHLMKQWSTGECAVKDMNLKAYRGEITVLLGHNGAGKSTTFAVISGLTKKTSGRVEVHSNQIGFCPQGNSLFDKLTCMDHLWFFHGIKGGSNNWKKEAKELLKSLRMGDKMYTQSYKLSGGMKRKLCLSMALIGNSRVVLLDEPTAGMDTGARQDVETMLNMQKRHRTILLTTHYMDEAEALGDRIIIMVRGRDVAYGTPQFLKKRFGTGYILTIDLEDAQSTNQVTEHIKTSVPEAKLERAMAKQVDFILPIENQKTFPQLFSTLERYQKDLGILAFGLSINTLEQVFLKVGEMTEKPTTEKAPRKEYDKSLDELTTCNCICEVLVLFIWKRLKLTMRSWIQFIFQFFVPVAIALCFGYLIDLNGAYDKAAEDVQEFEDRAEFALNFSAAGRMQFLAIGDYQNSYFGCIPAEAQKHSNMIVKKVTRVPHAPLLDHVVKPFELPPVGAAIYYRPDSKLQILFNSFSRWIQPVVLLKFVNAHLKMYGRGEVVININLKKLPEDEDLAKRDTSEERLSKAERANDLVSFLVAVLFSLVVAPFVVFLINERVSNFLAQQVRTCVSPFVLHGTSVLFDLTIFAAITGIMMLGVRQGNWVFDEYIKLLIMLGAFFFATYALAFLLASLMSSASKSNTLLTIFYVFGTFTCYFVFMFVPTMRGWNAPSTATLQQMKTLANQADGSQLQRINEEELASRGYDRRVYEYEQDKFLKKQAELLRKREEIMQRVAEMVRAEKREQQGRIRDLGHALQLFCPGFTLLYGVLSLRRIANPNTDEMLKESGHITYPITLYIFVIQAVACAFVSFWIRAPYIWYWWARLCKSVPLADVTDDTDVQRETQKVEKAPGSFVLECNGLVKYYGSFRAVNWLTFGLRQAECFGLLGINGAGKTSAFSILTGEQFANAGVAKLGSVEIRGIQPMGYCPQFDAYVMEMTGREVVYVLATLYGYKHASRKTEAILQSVMMQEHAHKQLKHCSGGQRRKISTGIALMASCPLVILDEPTAGIDPKARREIWALIATAREAQKRTVMLCSHSMDECEALCTRIGILTKGHLRAIGSTQHLKSKFGNSFQLTLVYKPEVMKDPAKLETVKTEVHLFFPAAEFTQNGAVPHILIFKIPKAEGLLWSKLWQAGAEVAGRCVRLRESTPYRTAAEHYSVAQDTLTQAFLNLSRS